VLGFPDQRSSAQIGGNFAFLHFLLSSVFQGFVFPEMSSVWDATQRNARKNSMPRLSVEYKYSAI
jgi:hypothetical protein